MVTTQLGRPRSPHVEAAVLEAVLDLLVEGGYDAVSFQRVAARAGVGQPTVYRRWPTKPELVEAAVFSLEGWHPPRRTGRLRKDLRALAIQLVDGLLQPAVRAALPGLVLAYGQTPGGHDRLKAWAEAPVRDAFAAIVAEADSLPRQRDVEALFDVFLAGLVYPVLTRDPDGARGCVDPLVRVIESALRP
jgi:AcrR family transcriptional regulator